MAERRLAAIMFSDIVGYTALMAESEEKGLHVRARHRAVLGPRAEQYHGQIVDENGDELVLSFASAVDAVNCALAVHSELRDDAELRLRIGIHQGDVVFEDGRIYGDGVNVASRIRPLADPRGICVSDEVQHAVQNQENVETRSLGSRELKNVPRAVEVFAVTGTAEPPRPVTTAATEARRRRLPQAAWAAAAVVVIAVGAGWWLYRSGTDLAPIRSIAVLPLENLSGDPEQEYFADGMTEAVISEFARIASLRVISRTSVMQYKKVRKPLPEIARELNVQGVVEGTVLRAGERVRITLQLIDARNDHHVWAESYERDLRDVLALQGEIARAVAREVRAELTPEEERELASSAPVDPALHDLYLRGRFFWNQRTPDGLERAAEYFQQVVDLDPDHADAYAGLADTYLLRVFYDEGSDRALVDRARTTALRALEIDSELAEAHISLGGVYGFFDWKFGPAEVHLRRGTEIDPSYATGHQWLGELYTALGRGEEAVASLEEARRQNPVSEAARTFLGLAYAAAGRYEDAIASCEGALELDPDHMLAVACLGGVHFAQGRPEKSVSELERVQQVRHGQKAAYKLMLAQAYAGAGRPKEAERIVAEVSEAEYVPPMHMGLVYSALGDDDRAFEWLDRAFSERDPWILLMRFSMDGEIRSDPRFDDLLRRIGFPES